MSSLQRQVKELQSKLVNKGGNSDNTTAANFVGAAQAKDSKRGRGARVSFGGSGASVALPREESLQAQGSVLPAYRVCACSVGIECAIACLVQNAVCMTTLQEPSG